MDVINDEKLIIRPLYQSAEYAGLYIVRKYCLMT